jgi:hypothetical protein
MMLIKGKYDPGYNQFFEQEAYVFQIIKAALQRLLKLITDLITVTCICS